MKKWIFIFGILCTAPALASGLPHANVTIAPHTGGAGSTFIIDAGDSRNAAGNPGGIEMRCQVSPTSGWTDFSARLRLEFTSHTVGEYTAKCQIRDRKTKLIATTYRPYKVINTFPRSARIVASDTKAYVGHPVDLELRLSTGPSDNPNEVQVRWDYDNDGKWDTGWSRQKKVSPVFDTTRTVSPRAEVKFQDDEILEIEGIVPTDRSLIGSILPRSRWSKLRIVSAPVVPPIVSVSPAAEGFAESTMFHFDASRSAVPRLGWMEWSIDGQQWKRFPRQETVSLQFDSPGEHRVRTRTCIRHSNPFCAETETTVDVLPDPVDFRAEIMVQNQTRNTSTWSAGTAQVDRLEFAEVGDTLRFWTVLWHQPVRAQNFQYRWKVRQLWNETEEETTPPTLSDWKTAFIRENYTHLTFDRTGEYAVTVEIRNEDSTTVTATEHIRILQNTPPTARIWYDPYPAYAGERIRFWVSPQFENSTLQPQYRTTQPLEARFDLDGDGQWDNDFRTLRSAEWVYEDSGKVRVRMQIRDAGKNVRTLSREIMIFAPPQPEARVVVSHQYVPVGQRVTFDARSSVGQNLQFFWAPSSGVFSSQKQTVSAGQQHPWQVQTQPHTGTFRHRGAQISTRFDTPGEKRWQLWVQDPRGEVDWLEFAVTAY